MVTIAIPSSLLSGLLAAAAFACIALGLYVITQALEQNDPTP